VVVEIEWNPLMHWTLISEKDLGNGSLHSALHNQGFRAHHDAFDGFSTIQVVVGYLYCVSPGYAGPIRDRYSERMA
jgi:hypothetical protein